MRHLRSRPRPVVLVSIVAIVALFAHTLAACGSGGDKADNGDTTDGTGGAGTTRATVAARPLRILVTNDDGVGAKGIDALVEALRQEPDVEVTVVAPAANQSGTGGKFTDGPVTVVDAQTASGYTAKSVSGYPADSVIWAVDGKNVPRPDLVMSGINEGQNLGPVINVSGTVGAARAAVARGIPAVALSQGLSPTPDFPTGARIAVEWLRENRGRLAANGVVNLNIPTCSAGSVRTVVDVPAATGGNPLSASDCTSTATNPADDVQAFAIGFVPRTLLPAAA